MADSSLLLIRINAVDKKKLPKPLRRRTFLDYSSSSERIDWEQRLLKHIKFDHKDSKLAGPSVSNDKVQLISESNLKCV